MTLNLYSILKSVLNESVDQQSVVDAMDSKRVILITYDDDKPNPHLGSRWIEPCSLVKMKNGDLAIRAYEYRGDSRKAAEIYQNPNATFEQIRNAQIPNWRLFKLNRISSWKPTTSQFYEAPDNRFNPNGDKQYEVIHQVHFGNEESMISKNVQNAYKQNQDRNVDYMGRWIDRKKKVSDNGPVPNQAQASVMNQPSTNQQGPRETLAMKKERQLAWKRKWDLEYQRRKREQQKLNNINTDDEDEMMSMFDSGRMFDNNDF